MKVGIVTIIDNNNYGNRLQNYAIQEYLKKSNIEATTLKNCHYLNSKSKFLVGLTKFILKLIPNKIKENNKRAKKFNDFNKNINFTKGYITPYSKISKKYDYFFVGSDQVWMPFYSRLRDVDLLTFARNEQKISFSASFGLSKLPKEYEKYARDNLLNFKAISVREETGKKIVEDLTDRKDVQVLIDPTMLLSKEEWKKVQKRPHQLNSKKYILNYFLGEYSDERKIEIEKFAKKNNCDVINILDKNSLFYETGPSEFLYLIENAFLICTDSFHSCVFSIIFSKPFIVFERLGGKNKINTRIETLLKKFELKDNMFSGKITDDNLNCDYKNTYKILEKEIQKVKDFLTKAIK